MLELRRNIWILSIKQILQLFTRIHICYVSQHFHLLLKLILQKPVVDPYHSLYVDSSNVELSQIIHMESWLYQVHTTYVPLVWCLSFLQSYVSSCLKLSLKSSDTRLICVSQLLVHWIKYLLNVVDLLLFKVINFLQLLDFYCLLANIINFKEQICQILI